MISCRPDRRFGRPSPRISDSELICLAIAQVLLDCPNERRFLRLSKRRLGHLFPDIPGQSGFNKRLRALAPQLLQAITLLAQAVALVLRPAPPARLDPGALRGLTRDRPPLRPGRDRRLRLLPLAQPLVLGLPPLPALQPRRAPDRLRARTGKRTRASHRRRTARASTRARPNRDLRQRLCRRRLRTAHPLARRHHPAPRPQRRTTPLRLTRRHPPTASSRRSTPSKTNSHSNATAAAPSPASSAESHDGYSPSPPSSSTTGNSAHQAATSPPTTTKESIV